MCNSEKVLVVVIFMVLNFFIWAGCASANISIMPLLKWEAIIGSIITWFFMFRITNVYTWDIAKYKTKWKRYIIVAFNGPIFTYSYFVHVYDEDISNLFSDISHWIKS